MGSDSDASASTPSRKSRHSQPEPEPLITTSLLAPKYFEIHIKYKENYESISWSKYCTHEELKQAFGKYFTKFNINLLELF